VDHRRSRGNAHLEQPNWESQAQGLSKHGITSNGILAKMFHHLAGPAPAMVPVSLLPFTLSVGTTVMLVPLRPIPQESQFLL
jgi:hypothetical protein